MGLEPIRLYKHKHLKLACLPIPALAHMAGAPGLEPGSAVLETDMLAATPRPYISALLV